MYQCPQRKPKDIILGSCEGREESDTTQESLYWTGKVVFYILKDDYLSFVW